MGASTHGGFGNTKVGRALKMNLQFFGKAISPKGHVTEKSISDHREYFLGKSASKLEKILKKVGYKTQIRPSKHANSTARIIVTANHSAEKNISQMQISKGSKRHGNVPYVKISTVDKGIFKIIDGSRSSYKTDGNEKAKLLFRRK